MEHFAALIGIDWSDTKHDVCLVDTATGSQELSIVKQQPASLDEWARGLRTRFHGEHLAVCLEQSRGPLIYALLKYDFLVLYPVNPKTLAKFREAFTPSRAKDDPTDAAYLVELLIHHRERLKQWLPDDEKTRTLQLLVEHRRRLVSDQTRISNRLTSLLKGYFPQVLAWFPDIRTTLVCDFLLKWPSLDTLKGVHRTTLLKFFRSHNSHRAETLATRLQAIKEATPLVDDRAVINSSVLMVKALASQMQTTLAAVREFDVQIEALCQTHEDFDLFTSLPGAGKVYASRLLTAMGSNRARWASADELLRFSGVAPVIERSGKSSWTRWRYLRSEVLPAIVRRVRGRIGEAFGVGTGFLPLETSRSTAAHGKLRLTPGWCRANARREVVCAVAPDYQRSVMLACEKRCTFRRSQHCGVVRSFKRGQRGCASAASAR